MPPQNLPKSNRIAQIYNSKKKYINQFYHSLIANRDSRPLKNSKNYSSLINFGSKNSNSDFHEFWPPSNEKIHFLYSNLKLTTWSRFFRFSYRKIVSETYTDKKLIHIRSSNIIFMAFFSM